MELGRLQSDCVRCMRCERRTLWQDFRHDLRCWGWETALHNLWARLTWHPDEWLMDEGEHSECVRR